MCVEIVSGVLLGMLYQRPYPSLVKLGLIALQRQSSFLLCLVCVEEKRFGLGSGKVNDIALVYTR